MSKVYFGEEEDYSEGYDYFMGFDEMTDEQIVNLLKSQPELMGRGRVKKWFQRRKKRATKIFKRLPKGLQKALKVTGAIVAAPAMAALGPGAAVGGIKLARKKRAKKLAKMTPSQRAAYEKRRKRRRRIAAGVTAAFVPGSAHVVAASIAAKKLADRRKKRVSQTRSRVRRAANSSPVSYPAESVPYQNRRVVQAPRRLIQSQQAVASTIPEDDYIEETPVQAQQPIQEKKSGLGALLPLAAGAALLPFIL